MKGWKGLVAAADAISDTPERWASSQTFRFKGEPRVPSPELVTAGFEVAYRSLSALGPPDDDEPDRTGVNFDDLTEMADFVARFPDRRLITGEAVRAYLDARTEPYVYPASRQVFSWRGLFRAWLRWQVGHLVHSIICEIPAFFESDPTGLREAAFEGVKRVALMLEDGFKSGSLVMIADRVERRVDPLARALYHHPNAGPKMKAIIDEMYEDDVAASIKADVPDTHDDPPWRP